MEILKEREKYDGLSIRVIDPLLDLIQIPWHNPSS